MDKCQQAILALNLAVQEVNRLSDEIGKSIEASLVAQDAPDGVISYRHQSINWLERAYALDYDDDGDRRHAHHDGDVDAYLAANCQHALLAHQLIQQRKQAKKARAIESALLSKLSAPAADERLGAYVREWATRQGWKPGDAEGAWEYAQRISYTQGLKDAAPYWARTYEDQDDYDKAVADAIKRVSERVEAVASAPVAEPVEHLYVDQFGCHHVCGPDIHGAFPVYRRAALARAPVAPQACPTDVCQAGKADGVLCANDECDRANGVRPASAPVAEKAREPVGEVFRHGEGRDENGPRVGIRMLPAAGGLPHGTRVYAAPQASECECTRKSKAVADNEAEL
ncbi:hypothetical protein [Achromobacter mucicolens]|uniref:hypothetical protein n=1 Tax=Achromobacter mucicolens TaxID=1389922 RepID=UPI003974D121